MKWLYIIGGNVIVIVSVMALIGALLPVSHVASRTAFINQPPEAVWEALTRIEEFPSWRKSLSTVEILPQREGRQVWRERGSFGDITMEQMEAVPPKRLTGRIADTSLAFGGQWIYELKPLNRGTQVTITEQGEVYNIFFRFMSRFIFGHTATIDEYLRDLGGKFGEKAEPVAAITPPE